MPPSARSTAPSGGTSTEVSQGLVDSRRSIFTLDELIRWRASEMGDSPLIGYPKHSLLDFEEHSARSVDRYVDAAADKLQQLGLPPVDPSLEKPPVVGILCQSGLHVVITIIALSRLGYTVFLISTRLASPALDRLIELTGCSAVITTPNFHATLAELTKERQPTLIPTLSHSDYYREDAPVFVRFYDAEYESKKVAIILHSSGSTGLPKPIWMSHKSCIGAFGVNMNMRSLLTSPLFHSHGFYEVFRAIYARKTIYLANYSLPITRQNLLEILGYVKPELFHCVPYVIKLLAESDAGIQALKNVDVVLFAGSSCPDDLGDLLVSHRVNLVANYGATETGRLMTSSRPPGDKYWNYLRLLPPARPFVLMDEVAPGLYECVALDGLKSKSTVNSDNPPGSFRTRDLFAPHPTEPGLWKYVCRLDDRFTLINGEKVLPISMEGRIRQEELVKEAVVFGEGKSYPGVLIFRADVAAHMPDGHFLKAIWPAVEAANSRAETFARIPKELIVVLPADAEYPRTDKGTFIRVPTYKRFHQEIESAYNKFENEKGGTLSLSGQELEYYLLHGLKDRLGIELSADDEFFALGVNSLQCIQMWNLIKKELDLGGNGSKLSQNVLYETGNVRALARHLERLRSGDESSTDEIGKMQELIDAYSSFEPHVGGNAPRPDKHVVLLTGVTGGLGAHLLAQLVSRANVSSVWAMVRAPTDTAASDRVISSLKTRGIELSAGNSSKVVPLACDLSRPDFGLSPSRLAALTRILTVVIHSAWAVNFNIPVQSFENQHIRAVHNLIQQCLHVQTPEPARFYFCSSVSAAGGTPRPGTVEEGPVMDPAHVQHTGYARSKYVAEHITRNAMISAGAPAQVLRIGQLIGDTVTGEWNSTEGVPMIAQTAVTLGALPMLDEEMSWLPVDCAATTIIELVGIAGSGKPIDPASDSDVVYHVLNPQTFHWTRDMLPSLAQAGLEFETLPTDQWMERLRHSDRDPTKNPPIKLLEWFESKYGHGRSTTRSGGLVYLTEETRKNSETLRNVPDVTDVGFVQKMLGRLRKHWDRNA
ncbi:hypothetical protein F5B22DRAFT_16969 [Xylaria bambusicola]|uniref:uncharacterized protein n=1 Tax=Xylaria bambusicola TaxID=326684 RepID=UPI0020075A7A|nr:uncharacterized protein F5B22DRAFT_16969 [Xylaria bambusicola]KAI0528045.1 hypothetical protein F5B22DRAFT_16969 [Xylaria bambusicola]